MLFVAAGRSKNNNSPLQLLNYYVIVIIDSCRSHDVTGFSAVEAAKPSANISRNYDIFMKCKWIFRVNRRDSISHIKGNIFNEWGDCLNQHTTHDIEMCQNSAEQRIGWFINHMVHSWGGKWWHAFYQIEVSYVSDLCFNVSRFMFVSISISESVVRGILKETTALLLCLCLQKLFEKQTEYSDWLDRSKHKTTPCMLYWSLPV